jgi:hypothetical protein
MAVNEGIRSLFPTQPSARSRKLRIYESLFQLNQGLDQVVAILRGMEKFPFTRKDSLQSAVAEIEEIRAGMNADCTEELADRERLDEGRYRKQRRAFERKWRDPDDVYIDVERREEERKKQGLIAASPRYRPSFRSRRRRTTLGSATRAEEKARQEAPEVMM